MNHLFTNKCFIRNLSLALFLSACCALRSQVALELRQTDAGAYKLDAFPYLQYMSKGMDGFTALPPEPDQLPVNRSYTFAISVKNSSRDTLTKFLQFRHNYVTATDFQIYSNLQMPLFIQARANRLGLLLAPGEEKRVVFTLSELNRGDPKRISLLLVSEKYIADESAFIHSTQSFFLGLFAFLFVFNTIIFLVTKWKVYAKYAVYILSALLYFSYYFGLLQRFFPFVNALPVNLAYTWYSIIFITYFIFLNDFGNYRQHVPLAHKLLNVGIVFKSVQVVFATMLHLFGFDFIYSGIFSRAVLVFEIILITCILFCIVRNRHIRGRLVILASVFLILGGVIEQTKFFPELDNTYFIEFGITAELLVFSVGLGYITKLNYDEKRNAEQLYMQQLIANDKLQKEYASQLELTVRLRTDELSREKLLVEKKNSENELLLTEIHHRVKNNLQVITSLLSLQEKSVVNKDAKRAILEGKERIRSMELVHRMLYRKGIFSAVEMKEYVDTLALGLIESFGIAKNEVRLDTEFPGIQLNVDTAIPVGLILNELIVNALKHGMNQNRQLALTIKVHRVEADLISLKVSDNGHGKLDNITSSGSFGLRIIKALVKQLDGHMEIEENEGIHYTIIFKTLI